MILEACVENLVEAMNAERLGAHQIELCDRLDLDGTSPSIESVKSVCAQINIPVKVIINPNPYNYIYNSHNIQRILTYIDQLNVLPVQGIVFGPLTSHGLPDLEALRIIADNTLLPLTYHKAIDSSKDIFKSTALLLEQNIVKFILSSGGKKTALEGADQLLKMKKMLNKSFIQLIGAGRITSDNLGDVNNILNLTHYHGKKIVGGLL